MSENNVPAQSLTAEELNRLALEYAIDNCWSFIDGASVTVEENGVTWFDMGADAADLEDEITLLVGFRLAEVHPQHPAWIREIAEL